MELTRQNLKFEISAPGAYSRIYGTKMFTTEALWWCVQLVELFICLKIIITITMQVVSIYDFFPLKILKMKFANVSRYQTGRIIIIYCSV